MLSPSLAHGVRANIESHLNTTCDLYAEGGMDSGGGRQGRTLDHEGVPCRFAAETTEQERRTGMGGTQHAPDAEILFAHDAPVTREHQIELTLGGTSRRFDILHLLNDAPAATMTRAVVREVK